MKTKYYFILLATIVPSISQGQLLSGRSNEVSIRRDKEGSLEFPTVQWMTPAGDGTTVSVSVQQVSFAVFSSSKTLQVSVQSSSMVSPEIIKPSQLSYAASRLSFSYQWPLLMGENTLVVTAETGEGARAVSQRTVVRRAAGALAYLANPPVLNIRKSSVKFSDENGDGKLDANEEAKISFVIANVGKGDAKNLNWKFSTSGDDGNVIAIAKPISLIRAGDSTRLEAFIRGGEKLLSGSALTTVVVTEPNGFDSSPLMIGFETVEFKAPEVAIIDGMFTSIYSGKMKRNTPTILRILVQNNGKGTAEKVSVKVGLPENVLNLGEASIDLGTLRPGQGRKLDIEFIANARYANADVPINIKITERYGKFGSEKTFTASLDEVLTSVQLDVKGVSQEIAAGTVMLRSLVDVDVPIAANVHPKRYALIIGNEDYMQFQNGLTREQNVAFARNDALVFREYAIKTLGCPANQVFLLTDATKGQMSREIDRVKELVKLQPGSELIFYYAGHGLPDFATQKGYLIPVDVSGANVKDGIGLSELYATLASSEASRVTVFLDACFSGGGRGENGLLAARTIKIKPTGDLIDGNIVVYTAASGEEASLPLKKESHGLFTYYLLQKLKDTSGVLTMQELKDYLEKEIPKASLIENGMKQTPQVLVSPKLNEGWAQWQF